MDRFPLGPGVSKIREKQEGTDGAGLEQRKGKFLAGELQRHGVVSPCQTWERCSQKGEQQDVLPHCHGDSQRAGWADLEMSPAWDGFWYMSSIFAEIKTRWKRGNV